MDKRIILILIILLGLGLFGIGGWFLFLEKEPAAIYEKTANALPYSNLAEKATLDSDNDGLKDWEEVLWKTDLNNPDTDEDGYTDSNEIQLGYDPTDAFSNPDTGNPVRSKTLFATSNGIDINEPLNLTKNLAKTMGSKIVNPEELEQADPSNPFTLLDETTGQGLLRFMNELRPQIPENEIKTRNDNSAESIEKYSNEIAKAIPDNLYSKKNEKEILKQALITQNFTEIDEYIVHFEQIINNLKKIEAPSDFFEFHKKEIELLAALKKIYECIKETETDPLKTVLALQEYPKVRTGLLESLEDFRKIYRKIIPYG